MKAVDSKIIVTKKDDSGLVEKEKVAGLYEVPVTGLANFETYEVLSVGEKVESVKAGDILATYKNPGHEFRYNGKSYRAISIPDILAVIDN